MNLLEALASRLEALDGGGWTAAVVFIAAYVAASVAFVPGAALTLIAGAVFGLARGVPIVFIGAVLGSSAAFGIARTVARERVARWVARDPRTAAAVDAVASGGTKVVLLLRLSPLVPYNLLNYALGVTTISYRAYLAGSIGMLPATVLYTYYGKVIGDVTAVVAGAAPARGVEYYAFLLVGLVATAAATVMITSAARKALPTRRDR
jgi:uncharacterized membrane protein YdjX (TVP38/TMEM64 family)